MQAQWLIFAALLMAVGGALLLLLQARNGSREQRLIERRLGALANPGGSTRWLAGMTERMDDSFWVRRLQLMDSEARQLLQQAGWHESRYRTLYLISVFLTPLLFVLLVLLVKLLRAESEASYAVPLLFAAGIGFLLPKQVLKHFAKARRALIADEMILFVQLIRILFDAGLTVEQTLRVVCLEGRGITPQLARELDLALTRADNGIDLAEELDALARRLQVDPLNDCCGVLRQMLRQGGSARSTLLTLKQLFEDRRLTTLQERIGKLSAKMSLVMMVLLFPALLIVLAGPGVIAIRRPAGQGRVPGPAGNLQGTRGAPRPRPARPAQWRQRPGGPRAARGGAPAADREPLPQRPGGRPAQARRPCRRALRIHHCAGVAAGRQAAGDQPARPAVPARRPGRCAAPDRAFAAGCPGHPRGRGAGA